MQGSFRSSCDVYHISRFTIVHGIVTLFNSQKMFPFAKTQKPHESFSLSRECLADLAEDNPHSQGQGKREENKLHHRPAKIPLITIFEQKKH